MAKVDIFMPFYVGDYLKDTNRLSAAEHGAYLMLMLDYWQNGPIPDDERILFRLSRMSADEWVESREVLLAYFKRKDGRLFHSRIDRELKAAKERKERYSELSKVGVSARKSRSTVNGTVDGEVDSTVNGEVHRRGNASPSPSPSSLSSSSTSSQDKSARKSLGFECKNSNILHKPEMAVKVVLTEYDDFVRFDVTSIACAITGEKTGPGMGFFSKQLKILSSKVGDDLACEEFREMLFRYWSEIKSGEAPDSVGAGLTERVKALIKSAGVKP